MEVVVVLLLFRLPISTRNGGSDVCQAKRSCVNCAFFLLEFGKKKKKNAAIIFALFFRTLSSASFRKNDYDS